jgi:hypothetical protein
MPQIRTCGAAHVAALVGGRCRLGRQAAADWIADDLPTCRALPVLATVDRPPPATCCALGTVVRSLRENGSFESFIFNRTAARSLPTLTPIGAAFCPCCPTGMGRSSNHLWNEKDLDRPTATLTTAGESDYRKRHADRDEWLSACRSSNISTCSPGANRNPAFCLPQGGQRRLVAWRATWTDAVFFNDRLGARREPSVTGY